MASTCAFIDWKGLFTLQYIMKLSILKESLLLCVYVLLHKCASVAYVGVVQCESVARVGVAHVCKCCTTAQVLHMRLSHKCASVLRGIGSWAFVGCLRWGLESGVNPCKAYITFVLQEHEYGVLAPSWTHS